MAERSPTHYPTNGQGSIQIQQLNGYDREVAGYGNVYFVDSPLPSTTFVDSGKSVCEQATNAVNISDDGARDVGCCSYIAESLMASNTITVREDGERAIKDGSSGRLVTSPWMGTWTYNISFRICIRHQ